MTDLQPANITVTLKPSSNGAICPAVDMINADTMEYTVTAVCAGTAGEYSLGRPAGRYDIVYRNRVSGAGLGWVEDTVRPVKALSKTLNSSSLPQAPFKRRTGAVDAVKLLKSADTSGKVHLTAEGQIEVVSDGDTEYTSSTVSSDTADFTVIHPVVWSKAPLVEIQTDGYAGAYKGEEIELKMLSLAGSGEELIAGRYTSLSNAVPILCIPCLAWLPADITTDPDIDQYWRVPRLSAVLSGKYPASVGGAVKDAYSRADSKLCFTVSLTDIANQYWTKHMTDTGRFITRFRRPEAKSSEYSVLTAYVYAVPISIDDAGTATIDLTYGREGLVSVARGGMQICKDGKFTTVPYSQLTWPEPACKHQTRAGEGGNDDNPDIDPNAGNAQPVYAKLVSHTCPTELSALTLPEFTLTIKTNAGVIYGSDNVKLTLAIWLKNSDGKHIDSTGAVDSKRWPAFWYNDNPVPPDETDTTYTVQKHNLPSNTAKYHAGFYFTGIDDDSIITTPWYNIDTSPLVPIADASLTVTDVSHNLASLQIKVLDTDRRCRDVQYDWRVEIDGSVVTASLTAKPLDAVFDIADIPVDDGSKAEIVCLETGTSTVLQTYSMPIPAVLRIMDYSAVMSDDGKQAVITYRIPRAEGETEDLPSTWFIGFGLQSVYSSRTYVLGGGQASYGRVSKTFDLPADIIPGAYRCIAEVGYAGGSAVCSAEAVVEVPDTPLTGYLSCGTDYVILSDPLEHPAVDKAEFRILMEGWDGADSITRDVRTQPILGVTSMTAPTFTPTPRVVRLRMLVTAPPDETNDAVKRLVNILSQCTEDSANEVDLALQTPDGRYRRHCYGYVQEGSPTISEIAPGVANIDIVLYCPRYAWEGEERLYTPNNDYISIPAEGSIDAGIDMEVLITANKATVTINSDTDHALVLDLDRAKLRTTLVHVTTNPLLGTMTVASVPDDDEAPEVSNWIIVPPSCNPRMVLPAGRTDEVEVSGGLIRKLSYNPLYAGWREE